jgi:hypothetical protein
MLMPGLRDHRLTTHTDTSTNHLTCALHALDLADGSAPVASTP